MNGQLNVFVKSTENFLEDFEKSFNPKNGVLSEYSNLILSFIFSKSQLFSLFLTYNPIGVSCGHDFLLTQRTRLGGPLRCLEHVRKVHKKEDFAQKFFLKWLLLDLKAQCCAYVLRYVSKNAYAQHKSSKSSTANMKYLCIAV